MPEEAHCFLFDLMQLCWRTGATPACWKESTTIMVHKRGDPHAVTNYRPICLCNTLAKLHTAVIARILLQICESGGLLGDSQAGSREDHRCSDLLQYYATLVEDSKLHKSAAAWCVTWRNA